MISSFRSYWKCREVIIHQLAVALALSVPLVIDWNARLSAQIFSPSSAWNLQIPATAGWGTRAATPNMTAGLDTWNAGNYWTIPYYTSTGANPLQPLLYNAGAWYYVSTGTWLRSGNSAAVEQAILASSSNVFPYPGNVFSSISISQWILPTSYNKTVNPPNPPAQFHFNANMLPPADTDGHMAVAQPNGSVVETYATIVLSSGQVVALAYAITSPTGLGDGWQNGQTASMLPSYAGLINDDEIIAGIEHAMAITLPAQNLAAQIAYPAYAFDRNAMTATPPYGGAIPMGGRLALPPSVTVSSLGLYTAEGKAIATAAKTYGFIVVDRGGGGITLRVRPNNSAQDPLLHAWNPQLQYDLNAIFAKVRQVVFTIPVSQ